MRDALEHVVGEQPLVEVLDVLDNGNLDLLSSTMKSKVRACDVGRGVLVLADMFGGTPCNVAMGCLEADRVEVISGFNLPLLIKTATLRKSEKNLTALAQQVLEAGRQYMMVATSITDEHPPARVKSSG
jgi:PTS system mannose-specific IIA component